MKQLQIYFSFRSPYAWLGCHRLARIIDTLGVEYTLIPISPPRKVTETIISSPVKYDYVVRDVKRMASAYGLSYRIPEPFDCDWFIPHAACLAAIDTGAGLAFVNAMFRLRFCEGQDISSDENIHLASKACGLDAAAIIEQGRNKKQRRRLLEILSGLDDAGIFGVPIFIYGEDKFWGNDRLEWCIREINRDAGKALPDLANDPLTRPF